MNGRLLKIEVPEPLYEQLDALATLTSRSADRVVLDALRGYVALEAWQLQDIQAGLQEAEAGEFAAPAEVGEVFRRYGA